MPRCPIAPARLLLMISLLAAGVRWTDAQRLTTAPQTFQVRVGDSVELPCTFEDLNSEDKVVVWKRGLDVIAIDEEVTIDDKRFSVLKAGQNYALRIAALEPYDTADYVCSATTTPPLEVTHKLLISVAPTAKLSSPSPLQVRLGEEVTVKCVGAGNPPPVLHWRRRDGSAPPPTTLLGKLHFDAVRREDAGVWQCRASNGVGSDALVELELRVDSSDASPSSKDAGGELLQFAPWVETDRLYIPVTTLGSEANLTCRYDGDPTPMVDWLFSGFKINQLDSKFEKSAQYGTVHGNYSVAIFALRDTQEDHFGDYTCRVANNLGTTERTIHLSGKPGPPALEIRDGRLHWTVESVQPITEYKVLYRLPSEDVWSGSHVVRSTKEDQQGDLWVSSAPLTFLKSGTDYELQVSAKNALGYGSLARTRELYNSANGGKGGASAAQGGAAPGTFTSAKWVVDVTAGWALLVAIKYLLDR